MTLIGIDAGSRTLREADHLVQALVDRLSLPPDTMACTHPIRSDTAHIAVSIALPGHLLTPLVTLARTADMGIAFGGSRSGPVEFAAGAAQAVAQLGDGEAGRAVVYPGVEALTGVVTVDAVLASTAIERVAVLGGQGDPAGQDKIRTRNHVRPEWREGVLTLVTTPVRDGVLAPFEVPNPTPCCADRD